MFPCPWNNSFVTVTLNGRSLVLLKSLIFLIFNWGKISILPKQKQSHLQSCRLFCQNHGSEDSSISKKNLCVSPLPGCLDPSSHPLLSSSFFSIQCGQIFDQCWNYHPASLMGLFSQRLWSHRHCLQMYSNSIVQSLLLLYCGEGKPLLDSNLVFTVRCPGQTNGWYM